MGEKRNQDDITTVKIERELRLLMAGASVVGTREYQQDTYYMMDGARGSLAVICDGMGGMEHGELASRKAVEKLAGDFEHWTGEDIPLFLKKEAEQMDRLVAELKDENGNELDAGTTVVCVIVSDGLLYWMSVGDSRIYVLRGEEMYCVTRDHNYGLRLAEQRKSGKISEEEFEREKGQAEALISYLGMDGLELLDVSRTPLCLEYGDRILLCSDGLYKCLSEEFLKEKLLYQREDIQTTVEKLMQDVLEADRRNKDNTTAVLLACE